MPPTLREEGTSATNPLKDQGTTARRCPQCHQPLWEGGSVPSDVPSATNPPLRRTPVPRGVPSAPNPSQRPLARLLSPFKPTPKFLPSLPPLPRLHPLDLSRIFADEPPRPLPLMSSANDSANYGAPLTPGSARGWAGAGSDRAAFPLSQKSIFIYFFFFFPCSLLVKTSTSDRATPRGEREPSRNCPSFPGLLKAFPRRRTEAPCQPRAITRRRGQERRGEQRPPSPAAPGPWKRWIWKCGMWE